MTIRTPNAVQVIHVSQDNIGCSFVTYLFKEKRADTDYNKI
jgi:hypothetical protein